MREILFKGKTYEGEWVQGDLYHRNEEVLINNFCEGFNLGVIPETVGQYTGLTDKNGTKIFEGDIVKDEQAQMLGEVVYATAADGFDGMAGFMVDDIDDGLQNYNGFWHLVEVIGNIHDNHELLESEVQGE